MRAIADRLNLDVLKAALLGRAEEICHYLLPAGRRVMGEYRCGDLRGAPGKSLGVNLRTGRWKDFAAEQGGSNLLELWRAVRECDIADAIEEAAAFCGTRLFRTDGNELEKKRASWPTFGEGSKADLRRISTLRGIAIEGVRLAFERGFLRFAKWRGHACWIITDSQRRNAQARRTDGKSFSFDGGSTKAITLPGSSAGYPLGIHDARGAQGVPLVEGGPDMLAAHGVIWAERRERDVAIVGLLGASQRPAPAIWAPLQGRRVRIFPHDDDAGRRAASAWAAAIAEAGAAKLDGFSFAGLCQVNGAPVGDLNDFLNLDAEDFEADRTTWEVLP